MEQSKGSAWTEYAKARNHGILRGVVAGYLVYLGGSTIYDLLRGTSSLSPVLGWIAGPLSVCTRGAAGRSTKKQPRHTLKMQMRRRPQSKTILMKKAQRIHDQL